MNEKHVMAGTCLEFSLIIANDVWTGKLIR